MFPNMVSPSKPSGSLDKYPGFRSPKTAGIGIRYPLRWSQAGLLMANFDPQVRAMRAVDTDGLPCSSLISFAFRAELDGGSLVIVLVEDGVVFTPQDFEPLGNHVALRRAQVTREPMASAMRTVWSNKGQRVLPGKRLKMLTMIAALTDGIRLDALVEAFPTGEDDGVADVLRLVCDNDLSIELERGIVPEAIIRRVTPTKS